MIYLLSADFFQINFWKKSFRNTVKPVFSGHSKIDKTNTLMTNGSLMKVESIAECSKMKVESIAECSPWSILQYFWPALIDNRSWKPILVFFLSGRLRQVFSVPSGCQTVGYRLGLKVCPSDLGPNCLQWLSADDKSPQLVARKVLKRKVNLGKSTNMNDASNFLLL